MERCYEYLGCDQWSCVMRQEPSATPCWLRDDTLCNQPGIAFMREEHSSKRRACEQSGCIYYRYSKDGRIY